MRKYIGEAEKVLAQLFGEVRSRSWVLFFDEADALLGNRSEVEDAHDRYANVEIAYLLHGTEGHGGVTVLASNPTHKMDKAFGRIRF